MNDPYWPTTHGGGPLARWNHVLNAFNHWLPVLPARPFAVQTGDGAKGEAVNRSIGTGGPGQFPPDHQVGVRSRAMVAIFALLIAGVLGPGASAAPALPPRLDPGVLNGPSPRAIVLFSRDVGNLDIERLAAAGITHASVFRAIDAIAVLGPPEAYIEIAQWAGVRSVQRDARISFENYVARGDTGVDDVRAGKQPLRAGYTGKGVTVVVVDTGIDTTHPDMSNVVTNINMEPSWVMDDITDGEYSRTYSERPVGTDIEGHGTHVAGIVGGTGEAAVDVDQSGVAPDATLINCNTSSGYDTGSYLGTYSLESNVLACYDWMLAHRNDPRFPGGISVATNSWSTVPPLSDPPGALELMFRKVVATGISVVFAAGNDGPDDNTVSYPAGNVPEIITVGSICKSNATRVCQPGEIVPSSSRGKQIDVVAPGENIWSARAKGRLGVLLLPNGLAGQRPGDPNPVSANRNHAWYLPGSGTSMAAPHVAGVVALMLEANPLLTPRQIESIITRTATDRGASGFDHDYGAGVVNALSAVRAAERFTLRTRPHTPRVVSAL